MAQSSVTVLPLTKGASELYANSASQESSLVGNPLGGLLVAQSLPSLDELVRMGNTYSMKLATASAFNLVAAEPTTLCAMVLYNGEAAGGKSYVIHKVGMSSIVTTTALTPVTLLGQLVPNPGGVSVAPTHSATTTLMWSNSGKASVGASLAKRAVAVTLGFANYWDILATATGAATASIATGVVANLDGLYIVPPQGMLCLNVMAGTVATASGIMSCTWSEVQLTLGN